VEEERKKNRKEKGENLNFGNMKLEFELEYYIHDTSNNHLYIYEKSTKRQKKPNYINTSNNMMK